MVIKEPPYPERISLEKPNNLYEYDFVIELKNVCVKVTLLQYIKYIPIFTKTIRDMCLKIPRRKRKDPPIIKVVGKLPGILSRKISTKKYKDLGNPIFTTYIQNVPIDNTLIDRGYSINMMAAITYNHLILTNLTPTSIVLELTESSRVMPIGIIKDIMVSLDSWEYLIDLFVVQPNF